MKLIFMILNIFNNKKEYNKNDIDYYINYFNNKEIKDKKFEFRNNLYIKILKNRYENRLPILKVNKNYIFLKDKKVFQEDNIKIIPYNINLNNIEIKEESLEELKNINSFINSKNSNDYEKLIGILIYIYFRNSKEFLGSYFKN